MKLPKAEKRKFIKKEEFGKVAKKVRESMRDEAKYLREKNPKNAEDSDYSKILNFS